MYLEKLEIQGFKSFANNNKLTFSGTDQKKSKGITAIVGPNGSGKSNIADAIRWVLGEQSLKTLRGKKSEDVIFSGSDKKSQLSLAKVTLFLNNENNVAKAEKKAESEPETKDIIDKLISSAKQIIISRRVYRNGDSEYLLNNARVRLADVQMLLAKANFAQKTYSVIGQGTVGNFLQASASERKDFFDEATGVKQFQIKRDSALSRLESTYENLQQVDLLLTEIKPRLRSLTRQMDKLKKREQLEQILKATQLNYYAHLTQKLNKKLSDLNQEHLNLENDKAKQELDLERLNKELETIRFSDDQADNYSYQAQLRELAQEKSTLQNKINLLELELERELEARGKFDLSWLNNKKVELSSQLEKIQHEVQALDNSRPEQERSALESQLATLQEELSDNNQLVAQIRALAEKKQDLLIKLNLAQVNLEAFNQRAESDSDKSLRQEKARLESDINYLNQELVKLQTSINHDKEKELNQLNQSLKSQIKQLNGQLKALQQEIKEKNKDSDDKQALAQLVEEFLLKLEELNQTQDLTKIKEQIKTIKTEFRAKASPFLDGRAEEELKRVQAMQAEIISLTEKRQTLSEEINQLAQAKLETNEKISQLNNKEQNLSWQLSQVESKLANIDPNKKLELENNLTQIKKELDLLNADLSKLETKNKADSLTSKEQGLRQRQQENALEDSLIKERIKLLQEQAVAIENELSTLGVKIQANQKDFDKAEFDKKKVELKNQVEQIAKQEQEINDKLDRLNQAKNEEKMKMFTCQKNMQENQLKLNSLNESLAQIKIEATRQETILEELENNLRNDGLSLREVEDNDLSGLEIDLDKWQKTIQQNKSQLDLIGSIDEETKQEFNETSKRYEFLSKQTDDLNQAIKSFEQIIKELDQDIKSRFEKEFKIIAEKFNEYFRILFNGGSAKINRLMFSDLEENLGNAKTLEDYLEAGLSKAEAEIKLEAQVKATKLKNLKKYNAVGLAGIDIQAVPPGKKIQSISMLSGGERALTAIALICAIISANPSPFVVLDEVDASLDESNSERLAKILEDLSHKAQFIVITHNRATMRKANTLYGVTMQSDGVSQLLSVKLDQIKE